MADDDQLLRAWRGGDANAAQLLFERHIDALYRFFRNKAPSACEDLVQSTLLGCFEAHPRFRGDCTFRTFMFAIARKQWLRWLRDRGYERVTVAVTSSAVDGGMSASALVEHRREQTLILHALRRLPIEAQILLELFYWESLSGSELAQVLEIPEGTVRTRLRRARQLLQGEIQVLHAQPTLVHSTLSHLDDWASRIRGE